MLHKMLQVLPANFYIHSHRPHLATFFIWLLSGHETDTVCAISLCSNNYVYISFLAHSCLRYCSCHAHVLQYSNIFLVKIHVHSANPHLNRCIYMNGRQNMMDVIFTTQRLCIWVYIQDFLKICIHVITKWLAMKNNKYKNWIKYITE